MGLEWTITLSASFAVADSMRRRADRHHGRRSALVLGVTDDSTPAVADEARAVAACFPDATLLLGAEATGDSLLSLAGHCDVLHLACHGVHRASNPMFSALHLADRSVSAREVLSLRLDQPLVVLSACESGRHAGPGSVDEAIGFVRSFVAAGAEAVVVSLWLANDTVTRDLMVEFYWNLSRDLLPATALRKAQIAVAEHYPHPADWAPFVIHAAVPPLGGP